MDLTNQQYRDLYKKLPTQKRVILASLELSEIIDNITKRNNLDKRQYEIAVKAVVDFLVGTNNKEGIRATLANDIGVDNISSQKIFNDIESRILNNLDNLYAEIIQNIDREEAEITEKIEGAQKLQVPQTQTVIPTQQSNQTRVQPKENQTQNRVGTDFEQIILNQARAMQPARPAGEVPHNLPTNEPQEEKPKAIHNYIGESDPYREPIS